MKTFKLSALFLTTYLFFGATLAQANKVDNTMPWEMLPNESLSALAAKFYPKSKTMQEVFIRKTQQLNKDTPVVTDANTGHPTVTQIIIPTLESLAIKGIGVK